MAELSSEERLQPSLLDRLTDDAPAEQTEPQDKRVLPLRRLRAAVMRDLAWLLNSVSLEATEDLDPYPEVARSVINYGLPELSGQSVSGLDQAAVERVLRRAIGSFEPRILPESLKVRAEPLRDDASHHSIGFEIEGELWAQPVPVHLLLRTEVELEGGDVTLFDESGRKVE
jgi:type VI secretion system protein ImpF